MLPSLLAVGRSEADTLLSFIEDHIEWVDEMLGDPSSTKRTTLLKRHRDLRTHHVSIFERLLGVSSSDSVIGYTEANITLKDGKEFYTWPGNFRQFIGLERRTVLTDPRTRVAKLNSVPIWSRDQGIVILGAERGFKMNSPLRLSGDQVWTLMYNKRPIVLHYGTVKIAGSNFVEVNPVEDEKQGDLVERADYYNGELIHLISGAAVPESNEVVSFQPSELRFTFRHDFATAPAKDDRYEFRSFVPRDYDKVIALSVALYGTSIRVDPERRQPLKEEFRELFHAAKNYFRSVTTDRPPKFRNTGVDSVTVDPFAA